MNKVRIHGQDGYIQNGSFVDLVDEGFSIIGRKDFNLLGTIFFYQVILGDRLADYAKKGTLPHEEKITAHILKDFVDSRCMNASILNISDDIINVFPNADVQKKKELEDSVGYPSNVSISELEIFYSKEDES